MKKVLVTGGSGFVGANLVRRLLDDGHEVMLVLRTQHQPWRLAEVLRHCLVIECDVADSQKLENTLAERRPEWVFNLAAYGAYSSQTGLPQMVATNVVACAALLDACVRWHVEAFIQTGSSSEYGFKDSVVDESELLEPNSHYAVTKAAATHLCQLTARTSGLRAIILRLYSIYGPYEEPTRFIPTLLVECLRDRLPRLASARTSRDFVYIEDATDALLIAAANQAMLPGCIFNVASGTQSSLADVVQHARSILRVTAEPEWETMGSRQWDTEVWAGDSRAIQTQLGWSPTTSVHQGLIKTLEWFSNNPNLLTFYRSRIDSLQ